MITHKNVVTTINTFRGSSMVFSKNDMHLSYLPLAHIFERMSGITMILYGASIGFYRGDPLLLKEDIRRLRPTWFMSVPRLFNKFYDGIISKIEALNGPKRSFMDKAIATKLHNLRENAEYTHFLYDKAFA
jgi:long-chain acyl-CoA synthetase